MLELFLMILILSANLNDFRSNYTDCHKEVSVTNHFQFPYQGCALKIQSPKPDNLYRQDDIANIVV